MVIAMRYASRIFCAALLSTLATAGCVEIVGVEDFTLAQASGGSVCAEVHGCTRATAESFAGAVENEVYVGFSADGYDPRCIRVRDGMKVIFDSMTASFETVPLKGGVYPDVDATSPLNKNTPESGATFVLSAEECVYPYFSTVDDAAFKGAIFMGSL